MTPHKCPETHDLQSFVRFQLSDEEFHSIVEHLSRCPTCDETVCNLEKQSETIADRIRRQPPIPYSNEPECQLLLEKIRTGELTSAGLKREDRTIVAPPRVVRDYELLELLGQGGMGHVYRAVHQRLKRPVAIKLLTTGRLKDQAAVARFEREMSVLGRLDHPHIVRALDAGEHDGQHYLVMEYVDGMDLGGLAHRDGRLPIPEACRVIQQAATALQYAHERGCVHRDIKPSNLMLAKADHGAMVKVLDLGLARALEVDGDHTQQVTELTSADQIMGTLDYMAPEQGGDSHDVDIRADIYSLGATLYKLLTGDAPHAAHAGKSPMQRLMAIATSEPPQIQSKRPEIPAALAAIIHKMLAKQPEDRFALPSQVAAALEPFTVGANLSTLLDPKPETVVLASEPTVVRQPTKSPPPPSRRSSWLRAFFGAMGLLLCGVILSITTKNGTITVESPDGELPQNLKIVVSDGGNDVAILQAENNWSVKVTHGEFQVAVADKATGFEVEGSQVVVKRLGKTLLTVRKRGEPITSEVVETPATQPDDHGLILTGGNSFVELHQMPPIPAPLTLEAWVELKDRKKGHLLFLGSPLWVTLEVHDEKWAMSVVRPDQPAIKITTSEPAALNEMVHVAGCWDGQNALLFVNGKQAAVTLPQTDNTWSRNFDWFRIGEDFTGSPSVTGVVKGVRISKSVRYTSEFSPERNWQTDADTLGLYRCIERQGLGLADYSGHGRHGTAFGASWVPRPVADTQSTSPVFAVIRPSKAEREFSDLTEAIQQTQAGDVVEVRSQAKLPIRFSEPLFNPLILRAGKGVRPNLILEGMPPAGLGQDITFEGVDLDTRDVIWFREPQFTHSVTYRRCRVWGHLGNIPGKRVEFFDSIIVPMGGVHTGHQEQPVPVEAVFENCAIRLFTDLMRLSRGRHKLALRNCTVLAEDRDRPSLVAFGDDQSAHVDIESTGCLYHCRSQTDGLIDQRFLPQVTWKGAENCYSGDLYNVREVGPNGEWIGIKEQGLEAWKKLWPEPEQNSREVQSIRLILGEAQRADYTTKAVKFQENLNYWRKGTQMPDTGPDWTLLGTDDAYVTALRASGHEIQNDDLMPKPPADGPCTLLRDNAVIRGFVTLQEAVDAAMSGDIIEIRRSGPMPGCQFQGDSRLLTVRAGIGYQPLISGSPLSNMGSDRLVLEGLTVNTSIDGSGGGPPPNWTGTDPALPLFPGKGAIVRVSNCTVKNHISGWLDALDGIEPEITNTQASRLDLGLRPGKHGRLANSIVHTVSVNNESATAQSATLSVSHCSIFASAPETYAIHSAITSSSPVVLNVEYSHLSAARHIVWNLGPIVWHGDHNIYCAPHDFCASRVLPHDGNVAAAVEQEEGSVRVLPFEFAPGAWRLLPQSSSGYERRSDGKDFGIDHARLTQSVDRWYTE